MMLQTTLRKQMTVCFLIVLLSTAVAAEQRVYNLTYDQVGNLKQGFGQHYEYNEFNQLLRVRNNGPTGQILEEYVYDHEGQRLKKYEPLLNQTTYYISDEYIEVVNTTGTYQYVYYYENDVLVGREDPSGKKFFYHPDILGSTDLITNESGDIVEETTYEPHGEVIEGGQASEFLYTSKELDDQTGLYYFGARYYDPFPGLFIHPDGTITDIYNPQDLNRYAYVRNNPYKYVDPTGDVPIPIATGSIGGIIGFAIGAGSSIYSQYKSTGSFSSISYQAAGASALTGAAAGFVAGATFGLATPAIAQAERLGGSSAALPLIAGASGISNAAGTQAGIVTSNILTGQSALQGAGNPQDIGRDILLGIALGSLTYGAEVATKGVQTNQGFFEARAHALTRMQQRGITKSDIKTAIDSGDAYSKIYEGRPQTIYRNPNSKVTVPTEKGRIQTVFRSRSSYVRGLRRS